MSQTQLNLVAIEASLRSVQGHFDRINASLESPRDPLRDEVLSNLLSGYAYLNRILAADIDPFAPGQSRHLLRLNYLVLFGTCAVPDGECALQFRETERRFYDDTNPGGLRALMNYLADHRGEAIWRLAAGIYLRILSQPQLFIEGNHRTGALAMSYLLASQGQPPFVLTAHNAKAYFDPSSLAKTCRKGSLHGFLKMPRLRRCLAELIREDADLRFLVKKE